MIIKCKIVLCLFFLQILCNIEGRRIYCEDEIDIEFSAPNKENLKTCVMRQKTRIVSDNVEKISVNKGSSSSSIEAINFLRNKKIFYLPMKVAQSFPNLVAYEASETSLKEISKKNFEGLSKLRMLLLSENFIEKIDSDTFDDLQNLEVLSMYDNFLKQIPADTFQKLNKLRIVNFNNNICISERFEGSSIKSSVRRAIDQKCSTFKTYDVACDSVSDIYNPSLGRELKTCDMRENTRIIDDDVKIANPHYNLYSLNMKDNKNIHYLPVKIADTYPKLMQINAYGVPIEKISKKNFKGLINLKEIALAKNRIEVVPLDTFEDLTNLQILTLAVNGIKFLSPDSFNKLNKLHTVHLLNNICINEEFSGSNTKTSVQKALKGKCDIYHAYENVCEFIFDNPWESIKTEVKMCDMSKITKLYHDDIKLGTKDRSVTGLNFAGNKKVLHLPLRVHENFPDLLVYNADNTLIREVSKKNFNLLKKLRFLDLSENYIDSIYVDTFEDLVNLEVLVLRNNGLKFITAETFQPLNKLQDVIMKNNMCVDENFEGSSVKTSVQNAVRGKCDISMSFDECWMKEP